MAPPSCGALHQLGNIRAVCALEPGHEGRFHESPVPGGVMRWGEGVYTFDPKEPRSLKRDPFG